MNLKKRKEKGGSNVKQLSVSEEVEPCRSCPVSASASGVNVRKAKLQCPQPLHKKGTFLPSVELRPEAVNTVLLQ